MDNVDAILTSDWHLREDTPICRTDDFWKTQWEKVDFVAELQRKYNCPVLHAGDLFHHWKPSPYLISMTAKHLPNKFRTIYGQHDLPQHSLELKQKSGIYTLNSTLNIEKFQVLKEASWGQKPTNGSYDFDLFELEDGIWTPGRSVLIWHIFNYIGDDPWPGITSPKTYSLLEKYKQFDLIVTGDNHQSFSLIGMSGNLLVNPGCLTRQRASEAHYKPTVYLYNSEKNEVKPIELPIKKENVTREHLDIKKEDDERIDSFITTLKENWDVSISFEDNMKMFFETNRMRKEIKEIIIKAMDYDYQ